jgi:beta-glucosidase
VLPEGTGQVNQKGLDFYRRLLDSLAEAGIAPLVTLFHWDLPAALEDRGGWLNRDIASWFADYARVLFRALDGGVAKWATLNEPWVVTDGGYLNGGLAPGHRSLFEAPLAAHNLLRAHGEAVRLYRTEGAKEIGLVVNLEPKYPASQSTEDLAATSRADAYMNRQFLDPVFFGSYPEELAEIFGRAWPKFPASDFEVIKTPFDFLGINYYSRSVVRNGPTALPVRASRVRQDAALHTEMDWEVFPRGLFDTLMWVTSRYGDIPLYITENGAAFADPPTAGPEGINDPLRVEYLRAHLLAAKDAIDQGANLRGYCAWSFLDNFEWSYGFSKRFGIVHVDYATQKRTPKSSARFYSEVIRSRGAIL